MVLSGLTPLPIVQTLSELFQKKCMASLTASIVDQFLNYDLIWLVVPKLFATHELYINPFLAKLQLIRINRVKP